MHIFYNILIKIISRIFKIDPHYYVKNSIWLVSSQIITAILSLVTVSSLGYFLSQKTFGEYRYLLSIGSVIGIMYLSGYSTTLTRQIAMGNLHYYYEASKKIFYTSFFGSMVSLVLAVYYYYNNTQLALGILLIGLLTPFINKYSLPSSFFAGKKDFKKTAYFSLIPDIISAVCLVTASYLNFSTILLIATYLFTNLLGNFLVHIAIKRAISDLNTNQDINHNNLPYFDKDSIHYSIMNILGVIAINIDKVLIFTMIGSVELAFFFFAQAIPLQARGMLRIISTISFPKFVDKVIDVRKINRTLIYLLFFGLAGVLTYVALAPYIFKFIFPQYIDAIRLTQLFSLSVVFYPAIYLLSGIMLAKNSTGSLYKISIYNTTFNIVFLIPLTYLYGVNGAAIAAILNSLTNFTLFYFFFRKENTTS